MIENLIHTVSKETKPSQFGSLQASNSKNGNGLEGEFRALFQSFQSESENLEDLQTDQEHLDESDETETKMDESSGAGKGSGSDSEALKNGVVEKLIDQNSADHKTESAQETSGPAKITVIDESITETEKSRTKVEGGSTEMEEVNVSESGDQEVLDNRNPESKNERAEIQDLSKENTVLKTDGRNHQSESAQSLVDTNSANEFTRSGNPAVDHNHRDLPSEMKESLTDSALRVDKSSFDKTETESKVDKTETKSIVDKAEIESKVDNNDSRSASKVQTQNETESAKKSSETLSIGNDKPVQASLVENSILKQERSAGHIEKSEPEESKSESNKFQRFINVDEGSNTTPKSGEGHGTVLQQDGPINKMNNPVESKEPVLPSDEMKQFSSKESNSSTDLKSSEVYTQKSQDGDFAREKIQPTERDPKNVQPLTTFNHDAAQNQDFTLNQDDKQNHGETRLYTEMAEKLSERPINENIEKPIRIAQKPVESTVLIQDKVQPKRERNDLLFLNNNEPIESSRLTFPGIGADAAKQNASFSSGQYSEDFGGLSESEKNEILWKEHTAESAESDELNRSELSAAALSKLGDSTLSNHFLRRVLLPGLTQTVFTASAQSGRAENWQRHNFILEDGSKVQLSARKVDGVLQIKLGASIGELSKLLQIHQDEIREHLEKECNIKIDLQFEQGSGDQDQSSLEHFLGESTKKPVFDGGNEAGNQTKKNIKKQLHTVVTRNFGYNSKEWTA